MAHRNEVSSLSVNKLLDIAIELELVSLAVQELPVDVKVSSFSVFCVAFDVVTHKDEVSSSVVELLVIAMILPLESPAVKEVRVDAEACALSVLCTACDVVTNRDEVSSSVNTL